MKIIFLILASNDFEHELDLETQKKTWINQNLKDVTTIVLRGWNKSYYEMDQNTLYVPSPEQYSLILDKTILGLKYISKNYDFDILIRTNSSTYFDIRTLKRELNHSIYKENFYGGYIDKSKQSILNYKQPFEYISGAGIFMSKLAVDKLITINPNNYRGIFDDIAIDNFFKNQNLRRIRMTRNNLQSTHIFWPTYYIRTKNSSNSYSASKRMLLLSSYFSCHSFTMKIKHYLKIELNEIHEFFNDSEPFILFLAKNRVVLLSFLRSKLERMKFNFSIAKIKFKNQFRDKDL